MDLQDRLTFAPEILIFLFYMNQVRQNKKEADM
jgi:hypothetical protein